MDELTPDAALRTVGRAHFQAVEPLRLRWWIYPLGVLGLGGTRLALSSSTAAQLTISLALLAGALATALLLGRSVRVRRLPRLTISAYVLSSIWIVVALLVMDVTRAATDELPWPSPALLGTAAALAVTLVLTPLYRRLHARAHDLPAL
ncbi:hypothetical protein GCM10027589_09570 [Actinocorallia lasiicapitis]